MSCGGQSVFGNQSQFIKFQGNDIIAVEGVNTVERLLGGDLIFPYKQLLKSRVILKTGQVNYLLNHLGLGDNATFLAIKATYNTSAVNEEDNYILWNYYDDFSKKYPMGRFMILTGNSTNRIKQLYLTNPSTKYPVVLDIMVASIDDTYSFFPDIVNQTATTFTGLSWTDIDSYVVGESILVKNIYGDPLIYISLSNINSIFRSDEIVTIDDASLGILLFVFVDEDNAAQAFSLLNYILSHPSIDISTLPEDNQPPVIYWLSNVGLTGSYIDFMGSTSGVPYSTSIGNTFSTSISLGSFGPTIDKQNLMELLVGSVSDNRDGIISLTTNNLIISASGSTVSSITMSGTYLVTFDLSDLALNNIDDVIFSLDIQL